MHADFSVVYLGLLGKARPRDARVVLSVAGRAGAVALASQVNSLFTVEEILRFASSFLST